ncbi:glycosyltransferase [Rhodohalobacter sp. SW132]|uniref:TIGR04282 family arsenosugar biosynthesis glycosyltransferase n=1 Tax=Rhodohalobacter sp. SW132 TaxID=2293433 RepID=UPI000E23A754|nr:TIGR04282 family arsenosugar biosynthesis glycosyltransferase [Rhodohalobacter sp. SW132]REL24776.1 glycosyltransferase [Rhodohalobacter sp. SW132]
MHSKLLLIFVKNPVAGEVKTRLARDVGSLNALQIYKQLLRYTREVASAADADRQVWYSSKIDRRDAWSEEQFLKKLQKGDNLGERMSEAFRQGFEQGYQKIVIIGSDCAELTAGHLERAYQALENRDAAIGPSEDGGYYLLGLTSFEPGLFRGVDWSTSHVFQQTLEKFEAFKMSYDVLETLNDIDTVDDLKRSSLGIQ